MQEQNRVRIAIVEDNADSRELLRIVLQDSFEVITCVSGEEALTRLPSETPDVVLCDLRLPDLDGRRIPQQLRTAAMETAKRLPEVSNSDSWPFR